MGLVCAKNASKKFSRLGTFNIPEKKCFIHLYSLYLARFQQKTVCENGLHFLFQTVVGLRCSLKLAENAALSLAGNLEKPLMSLYETERRERRCGLSTYSYM